MRISDWSSDVCSSDLLTFILIVAALGAMSGVLVFVARADGAGDLRRTGRVLREGLVLGLGFGVAAWIVLFGFASELLAAVGIVPALVPDAARVVRVMAREEDRRVGEGWVSKGRSRWWPYHLKKKKDIKHKNK